MPAVTIHSHCFTDIEETYISTYYAFLA